MLLKIYRNNTSEIKTKFLPLKIMGGRIVFLEALEEPSCNTGASYDISYKLLYQYTHEDLERTVRNNSMLVASNMKRYYEDLNKNYMAILSDRSPIVRGLFLLYQTASALSRYNENILNLSNIQFRDRILFPYLIQALHHHLPDTRKFLYYMIRTAYENTRKVSQSVINYHVNSFYLDQDVIKHDVLLSFLGNGLKKYDPLSIDNVNAFYRKVFKQIFLYYFMRKQKVQTICTNFWGVENSLKVFATSTRLSIYRDVLYSLEVEKFYEKSPLYSHLGYNYRIFRNIIINNELQDIYMTVKSKSSIGLNNNEYKLLKVYDDDMTNDDLIEKIRKLPTIFKLLKCVHLANSKAKAYNDMIIKPELLKTVVRDELMYPFRNFFDGNYLLPILDRIVENFTNSILSGEYINLLTFSPVKINQISFIEQVKKFVKICLDDIPNNLNPQRGGY
jgi:hypothetical protein